MRTKIFKLRQVFLPFKNLLVSFYYLKGQVKKLLKGIFILDSEE